jgi:hypothetical protein
MYLHIYLYLNDHIRDKKLFPFITLYIHVELSNAYFKQMN